MKILVTGANGFIGRILCEKLINEGYLVRGVLRDASQMRGLPLRSEKVQVGSICSVRNWSKALTGVNVIVHLAAKMNIFGKNSDDSYASFKEINILGTKYLAQQAITSGVKRFVFISTVKVNGEGKDTHYNEKDNCEPVDFYAKSKWEAEKMLYDIAKNTGMEIVILRSPLVYGPHVKGNILRLLKIVERGIPVPFANVKNRRSLIYSGNLVDAIVTCMKHPKAAGRTYFVSDREEVSTPELIRGISSSLGRPVRLFPFPSKLLRMAGIFTEKYVAIDKLLASLTVDCSKISRDLGWQAPFSMEQGLKETAKWYLNEGV